MPFVGHATNYWFAATGNDTHAGTLAAPFRSLSKWNSLTLNPGDTTFFNRGDAFPGNLRFFRSGSSGNNIIVTAYGSGPMPVIGGLISITGWGIVSGNTYQTTAATSSLLVLDGRLVSKSGTPNETTGYYTPFTPGSVTTFTDATHLPGSPNLIGDTILVRSSAFTLDKVAVSGQTSTTLTFAAVTYSGVGGAGWKIWGDFPDSNTEWRDSLGYVQMNFGGSGPAGHVATVPQTDSVIYGSGNYVTFDHLNIVGGNVAGIYLSFQTAGIVISNDSIEYCLDGIFNRGASAVSIINTFIAHMGDNAIYREDPTYNWLIIGGEWRDIGMHVGMGLNGNSGTYQGINEVSGDSATKISGVTIDSIGYIGASASGSGFRIDSNVIHDFCQVKEDGGGIYTWIGSLVSYAQQRWILNNIIYNGGGPLSHNGVSTDYSSAACGAYLDNWSSNDSVAGNTVYNVNSVAYFDHGPSNIFKYNTSFGAAFADIQLAEAGPTITGMIVKHNIFGSANTGVAAVRFSTINSSVAAFGVSDSNSVLGSTGITIPYYTKTNTDAGTFRSPSAWTTATGFDTHSTFVNGNPYLLINICQTICSVNVLGLYADLLGTQHFGAIGVTGLASLLLNSLNTGVISVLGGHRCCKIN